MKTKENIILTTKEEKGNSNLAQKQTKSWKGHDLCGSHDLFGTYSIALFYKELKLEYVPFEIPQIWCLFAAKLMLTIYENMQLFILTFTTCTQGKKKLFTLTLNA